MMSNEKRPSGHLIAPNPPTERPGPKGGKRHTNRRQRIESICASALVLFLARGVESTTIGEIVTAAGIAKGSFYRYFDDKSQLVETLFAPLETLLRASIDSGEQLIGAADGDEALVQAYQVMAAGLAQALLSSPDLIRLYLQESRAPAVGARVPICRLSDDVCAAAVRLTQVAQDHGLLRDIEPRVSAYAVVGAVERLLAAHLSDRPFDNPMIVAFSLISMVMSGLRPESVG